MTTKDSFLSTLANRIPPSGTIEMASLARNLEQKGKPIIHLEIGQPSFNTPAEIIEAAHQAMIDGKTGYTNSKGILPLREKIAEYHSQKTGLEIKGGENVIITPGAKASLFAAMISLLNPEDKILFPSPYWPSYEGIASCIGSKMDVIPTNDDFSFSIENLKEKIDNKTQVLLINSPNNPTGVIYDKKTLQAINDLSVDHNFIVLSDEIYREIIFDGHYPQYLSVSESFENSVIIDGFSKSHAMTGWRIGYALGKKELINAMNKIQQNTTTCTNAPTQWGALATFGLDAKVKEMVEVYQERRDKALNLIEQCDNLFSHKPTGAFYLFVNYKGKISSTDLALKFLEKEGVCLTPGKVFGVAKNYLRISLASDMVDILEGINLLNDYLRNLNE
jgi:aspartate aminotransferase